jgi:hypothetical protein
MGLYGPKTKDTASFINPRKEKLSKLSTLAEKA